MKHTDTAKQNLYMCQCFVLQYSVGINTYGDTKCRWGGLKLATFDKTSGCVSKMVQDKCTVYIKVQLEVVCAVSNGDIANDLE